MIIPIKWLKDYVKISKPNHEIAESFTSLGLLLDKPIKNNILDLEHRMDRSDWLSIIGCARDLAAFEGSKLKYPKRYTEKGKSPTSETLVPIKVTARNVVNRFNTRVFKDIQVKDSPKWLRDRLESYGLPSINNIVDITNFVMVEYGQPMHAQDLNKFNKREIVLRFAKDGESITTLLGEKVKLDPKTFILAQNDQPIVIGGVVGGLATGVTEETVEFILDAGNYDQRNVRSTSRRLKIQNESVLRYDKFLHPNSTQIALERATQLILDLAGGQYYENVDWYPHPVKPQTISLRPSRVKMLSGMDIPLTTMKSILKRLEYQIVDETKNKIVVEIPYFRTDVIVEDDLIADILRINDYSLIPTQMMPQVPPKEITTKLYKLEDRIRDILVSMGLHEHITDPLVETRKDKEQISLVNALTSEKSALRTSINETLKKEITTYSKHDVPEISIFEIGLSYHKNAKGKELNKFAESRELAILYKNKQLSPNDTSLRLRSIIAALLESLNITSIAYNATEDSGTIKSGEKIIGTYTHTSATFDIATLALFAGLSNKIASAYTNYQTADLSLEVPTTTQFGQAIRTLTKEFKKIKSIELLEEGGTKVKKDHKSILIRLKIEETADLQKILAEAESLLKKKYNISTRN